MNQSARRGENRVMGRQERGPPPGRDDTESTAAPWYGVRDGKDGVQSFFEAFGATMDVDRFELVGVRCERFRGARHGAFHGHPPCDRGVGGDEPAPLLPVPRQQIYYRGSEDSALAEALFLA